MAGQREAESGEERRGEGKVLFPALGDPVYALMLTVIGEIGCIAIGLGITHDSVSTGINSTAIADASMAGAGILLILTSLVVQKVFIAVPCVVLHLGEIILVLYRIFGEALMFRYSVDRRNLLVICIFLLGFRLAVFGTVFRASVYFATGGRGSRAQVQAVAD